MNKGKFLTAVVLLLSAMMLGGCATALIGPNETQDSSSASATVSVDPSTVLVAEVNGEKIYKDAYESLLYQKYMNEEDFSSDEAIALREQETLDTLINNEVRTQKMAELGYSTLTDEEAAEAEERMQEDLLSLYRKQLHERSDRNP